MNAWSSSMIDTSRKQDGCDVHNSPPYLQPNQYRYSSQSTSLQHRQETTSDYPANSYSHQQEVNCNYDRLHHSAPTSRSLPSPYVDKNSKFSLPSISSLLELSSGAGSLHMLGNSDAQAHYKSQRGISYANQSPEIIQSQSQYVHGSLASKNSGALSSPVARRMHSKSLVGEYLFPTAAQSPGYYGWESANSMEARQQQIQPIPKAMSPSSHHHSTSSQDSVSSSFNMSQFGPSSTTPHGSSPVALAAGTPIHYSPKSHEYAPMYHHQELSPNPASPSHVSCLSPSTSRSPRNSWQYHHYISASNQGSISQANDRYVCPTCKKAFSRPSSLRIHSHSHTGEKPFKCPQSGCGKAFSIRSNMKRHERGCHISDKKESS